MPGDERDADRLVKDPGGLIELRARWMLKHFGVDVLKQGRGPVPSETASSGRLGGLDLAVGKPEISGSDRVTNIKGLDLPEGRPSQPKGKVSVEGLDLEVRQPLKVDETPTTTTEGLDLQGVQPDAKIEARTSETLRDELIKVFEKAFDPLPTGARKVRIDELNRLRQEFINSKAGDGGATQVKLLADKNRSLRDAFAEVNQEITTLAELRVGLRDALTPVAPLAPVGELELVRGATATDQAAAQLKHRKLLADMADVEAAPDALRALHGEIEQLDKDLEALRKRVAERIERKERIEADALEVRLHPEAKLDAIDTQRSAVSQALQVTLLDDPDLEKAERALEALRAEANKLNEETGRAVALRDEYRKQLKSTVELLGSADLIRPQDLASGKQACENLLDNSPVKDAFKAFPGQLAELRGLVKAGAVKALEKDRPKGKVLVTTALKKELAALAEEAKLLAGNPNVDPGLLKNIPLLSTVEKALDPANRGGMVVPQVDGYFSALDNYRQAVQAARLSASEKTALIAVDRDVLLARVGKPDPTDAVVEFTGPLEGLRVEVRELLKDPLIKSKVDSARSKTIAFERLLVRAAQDVADAAEVVAARGRVAKIFDGIKSGARTAVKAELEVALKQAIQLAERSGKARDMAGARQLFAELEKRLAEVQSEADTAVATKATYLNAVEIDGKPADPALVDDAYDLLGPGALKILQQEKGGAKNILTVCTALKTGGPAVRQFYDEALGGNPKAFASLLRDGDGQQLKELADAFQDAGDRERFGALVKSGGLGDKPECLADLLNYGMATAKPGDEADVRTKNVAKLKQLGTAFGDKSGPVALKGILVDGGLGARPGKDKPGVMVELLHTGCDGQAAKLREFANAYAGGGPEAVDKRKNLKTLVEKGGFGECPTTLGPLLKNAGVYCLQDIGEQFAAPVDAAKLRTLLTSGGMSGDTQDPAHQHEHPDTLSKVMVDGFNRSATRLKTFANAFANQPGQCKDMLDAWNEFPDGKAKERQPGKQIAKLLDEKHLNNDVAKLQTKFTAKMQQIPGGTQRKLATRMAPNFNSEPGPVPGQQPAALKVGEKLISAYILERHSSKHAQKGKLDGSNSYFPVGTNDSKLAAIINEALTVSGLLPGQSRRVNCPEAGMRVEIAMKADGTICHCYPVRGAPPPDPEEIAEFSNAEATAIFEAIK